MPGFEEHIARLLSIQASAPAAAVAAVRAAQEPILGYAAPNVPIDTTHLLSTGQQWEPVINGTVIKGTVSYGDQDTIRPWHGGTGYELFQEMGTSNGVPAIHYLENATLEALPTMTETLATTFQEGIAR